MIVFPWIAFIYLVILRNVVGVCNEIWSDITVSNVISINSGTEFYEALKDSKEILALELSVINGTHWVSAGGSVNEFDLVITKPPSTSSDLTLSKALEKLVQISWFSKRILILRFRPPHLLEEAHKVLQQFISQDLNVLIPFDAVAQHEIRIATSQRQSYTKIFELKNKMFGLDPILERVRSESLLTPRDIARTKSIIEKVISVRHPRDLQADKTFILRRQRTLKSPNSFTDIYLQSIVWLLNHSSKNNENTKLTMFLPDLQALNTSYSMSDVQLLLNRAESAQAFIALRAGILANSNANVLKTLKKHPGFRFYIWSDITDQITLNKERLIRAIEMLGTSGGIPMLNLPGFCPQEELFSSDSINGKIPVPASTNVANQKTIYCIQLIILNVFVAML